MPRDIETTHRIMSAIKSTATEPEQLLGQAMWKIGLRYRRHYRIIGKPDFVFVRVKIAVFCDGDFWHGNNWQIRGLGSLEAELAGYSEFWAKKIKRNIERDNIVTNKLEEDGWLVLRFWESDIRKSPIECANFVMKHFESLVNGSI
jgi:DNA mismatch endonuclease (patch repair protein)